MRTATTTAWLVGAAMAGALLHDSALAQRRTATEVEARAFIHSAFITQADPAVIGRKVALGPELVRRLGLPAEADGAKVYELLIGIAGDKPVAVSRATEGEVEGYGVRRGFDPKAPHPVYTLRMGDEKFLLQYDLNALAIPFVGQLGSLDPDPPAVRAPAPLPLVAQASAPKPRPLSLTWSAEFPFGSTELTDEMRARLDAEVIAKVAGAQVRFVQVSGHADRLGESHLNQQISEKRALAMRDYLVAKGIDPEKVEVLGFGQTLPVKACPEAKRRSELIECLAPNRRAVLELQAAPR
jgi:outer membrane protein OmpA-like peptidoglycan-associated protein